MNSRVNAHRAVLVAVQAGVLIRPDKCSRCSQPGRIEGHHDDYSRPLDVMWLCKGCHMDRHRETNTGMRGRPRCIACGRVIYRHLIENGHVTVFASGMTHKGRCSRTAGLRIARQLGEDAA